MLLREKTIWRTLQHPLNRCSLERLVALAPNGFAEETPLRMHDLAERSSLRARVRTKSSAAISIPASVAAFVRDAIAQRSASEKERAR
jgi:hypothetical protein